MLQLRLLQHAAIVTTRNKSKLCFTYSNDHRTKQHKKNTTPNTTCHEGHRPPMRFGVAHETETSAPLRHGDMIPTLDRTDQTKSSQRKKRCTNHATCILGHIQRDRKTMLHFCDIRTHDTFPCAKSCALDKERNPCVQTYKKKYCQAHAKPFAHYLGRRTMDMHAVRYINLSCK